MKQRALFLCGLVAAALIAGCASAPSTDGSIALDTANRTAQDPGAIIGEVSPPRQRARAHTELAAAYFERGSMGVTLEELRIALAADPEFAPAYNLLGLVHMELKELPQAQQNFERALRISPNDADANHNYGWFLCRTGREEQGLRHLIAAVKNPLYATPEKSYALAGACAMRKGLEREAKDYLEQALRADPNHVPALIDLAKLNYRRGDVAAAGELVGRFNRLVEPTAESLWLALRIARRLGDRASEANHATALRRRFADSKEYQDLLKGQYQ